MRRRQSRAAARSSPRQGLRHGVSHRFARAMWYCRLRPRTAVCTALTTERRRVPDVSRRVTLLSELDHPRSRTEEKHTPLHQQTHDGQIGPGGVVSRMSRADRRFPVAATAFFRSKTKTTPSAGPGPSRASSSSPSHTTQASPRFWSEVNESLRRLLSLSERRAKTRHFCFAFISAAHRSVPGRRPRLAPPAFEFRREPPV